MVQSCHTFDIVSHVACKSSHVLDREQDVVMPPLSVGCSGKADNALALLKCLQTIMLSPVCSEQNEFLLPV